jgi:hypothetical protein
MSGAAGDKPSLTPASVQRRRRAGAIRWIYTDRIAGKNRGCDFRHNTGVHITYILIESDVTIVVQ